MVFFFWGGSAKEKSWKEQAFFRRRVFLFRSFLKKTEQNRKRTVSRATLDGLARQDLYGPAATSVDLVVDLRSILEKRSFWR
jgi:hypothetical protein